MIFTKHYREIVSIVVMVLFQSLIDGMTPEELQRTLIVISIGEANDLKYVTDTAYEINLLLVSYYPLFNIISI